MHNADQDEQFFYYYYLVVKTFNHVNSCSFSSKKRVSGKNC